MTHRQFVLPGLDELTSYDKLCVTPVDGETGVVAIRAGVESGQKLELVVDSLGRSVRLVVWDDGVRTLDVYREAATSPGVRETPDAVVLTVDFDAGELAGALEVSIGRHVRVMDVFLFR
ncbi:hypothetical protein [Rhodococcus sp. Q]|uniref:hypothetical protein n=1 Tax=Rhodococcus sp. Q TaxID=2502252 RepID=UPI0010F9E138|nr:hypothetical protein [Rhodococcus sp. Q]